jgi:uncharacterized protein YndB with AHSA1/START domain
MPSALAEQTMQTLEVTRNIDIAAPIEIVFETVLEQMGPFMQCPGGPPLSMTLEAWPGGRWFRDLGNNTGQLWGYIQSIVPPSRLELQGPMFIAAPVLCHVLYQLTSEGGQTHIAFSHRIVGLIPPDLLDGIEINQGWTNLFDRLQLQVAQRIASAHSAQ